ncbi:MAG: hypothetical protein AB7G06_02390 [Bdellovibrionales bacterium]
MASSLRIAYWFPYGGTAEQADFTYFKNTLAAKGHEAMWCKNSDEVLAYAPDFVLMPNANGGKHTPFPTYVILHASYEAYFKNRNWLMNLLAADGQLSIMPDQTKFVEKLFASYGRVPQVGYYSYWCNKTDTPASKVADVLRAKKGIVTYVGNNWDRRRLAFLHAFTGTDWGRVYGREDRWAGFVQKQGYGGPVGFDGNVVRELYAKNGIGLNILGDDYARDNVITNRIGEISSVGAVTISVRIPWLEETFGDSLYYFDENLSDRATFAQVRDIYQHILDNPEEAIEKAARARATFEAGFCADVLVDKLLQFHADYQNSVKARAAKAPESVIDVVVLDDKDDAALTKTLHSIDAQVAGVQRAIVTRDLWKGLREVTAPYFAIMHASDAWDAAHLLHVMERQQGNSFFYTLYAAEFAQPPIGDNETTERRLLITPQLSAGGENVLQTAMMIDDCAFVASSALLQNFPMPVEPLPALNSLLLKAWLWLQGSKTFVPHCSAFPTLRKGEGEADIKTAQQQIVQILNSVAHPPQTAAVPPHPYVTLGEYIRHPVMLKPDDKGRYVSQYYRVQPSSAVERPATFDWQHAQFVDGISGGNNTVTITASAPGGPGAVIPFMQQGYENFASEGVLRVQVSVGKGQLHVGLLQNGLPNMPAQVHGAATLGAGSHTLDIPVYDTHLHPALVLDVRQPGTEAVVSQLQWLQETA